MNQSTDRGHQTIGPNSALEGFACRTHKGKGRHGGTEYAHQKEEGAYAVTSHKIVFARSSEQAVAEKAKGKKEAKIADDNNQRGHYTKVGLDLGRISFFHFIRKNL